LTALLRFVVFVNQLLAYIFLVVHNLLFAITANKIVDYVLYKDIKGGLKTNNIIDFYNNSIKDKYKNYLIIMDNAVIHRSKIIRQIIEEGNNDLLYSVPYHPETNAIEEFFSQLKHYIKRKVLIHTKI